MSQDKLEQLRERVVKIAINEKRTDSRLTSDREILERAQKIRKSFNFEDFQSTKPLPPK